MEVSLRTKLWKHVSTRVLIELIELTTDSSVSLASRNWNHLPWLRLHWRELEEDVTNTNTHTHTLHTYTLTLFITYTPELLMFVLYFGYICLPLLLIIWYMLHSLCCLLTCICFVTFGFLHCSLACICYVNCTYIIEPKWDRCVLDKLHALCPLQWIFSLIIKFYFVPYATRKGTTHP